MNLWVIVCSSFHWSSTYYVTMATLLLNRGQINLVKNDIKPLCFHQIHFVWHNWHEIWNQCLRIDPSTKFQLNPSKNRKVGQKLDFDPKTKNNVTTGDQWWRHQFYCGFGYNLWHTHYQILFQLTFKQWNKEGPIPSGFFRPNTIWGLRRNESKSTWWQGYAIYNSIGMPKSPASIVIDRLKSTCRKRVHSYLFFVVLCK